MAIPLHGQVEVPLLEEIAKLGGSATPKQMYDALAEYFQLSDHDRYQLKTTDQKESLWENHVRQVRRTLVQKGEIDNSIHGRWSITQSGYNRIHANNSYQSGARRYSREGIGNVNNNNEIRVSETPIASDISEPSEVARTLSTLYRILRDIVLARQLKAIHDFKCQICGDTVYLYEDRPYIEAHHIKPLGAPHNGPDIAANIICVCPNHHVQLDYGAIHLRLEELNTTDQHIIGEDFINYHNTEIYGKRF